MGNSVGEAVGGSPHSTEETHEMQVSLGDDSIVSLYCPLFILKPLIHLHFDRNALL